MITRIFLSFSFILSFFSNLSLFSQTLDSIKVKNLDAITVQAYRFPFTEVKRLNKIQNGYIFLGKKNDWIQLQDLPANIAEKSGREIFAKIPGAFIYDMDGSGNQINFSTRGLDPHRSWEYNVRANDIMTNSDIYGYPASHYSPPMESIGRIELIRGTGSLLYGSQFGGMINYVTKDIDTSKAFSYEGVHSIGSFGLLSSYHAISGKSGSLSYQAYYQKRVSDGYRENARSDAQAQLARVLYEISSKLQLKAELARSQYLFRIPGPLTDSMFYADPRQASRSRNYFSPDIYVPSLRLDWKLHDKCTLQATSSAVLGTRNSVQFIGFANQPDTINAATLSYANRQIDIDEFNSYTSELKVHVNYTLFGAEHHLITGVRYIHNDLHRRQQGKGTTGIDYNIAVSGDFGRDIHYKTQNVACFAENLFRLTPQLSWTLGFRVESGESNMTGRISYLPNERIPLQVKHHFPLFGSSMEYHLSSKNQLYAGFSQAYRPVIFSDIIPANTLERTDPEIKDARGHNLEIGLRGKLGTRFHYDINAFQILYKNRVGSLVLTDDIGQSYIYKTNIGDSRTNGVECFVDLRVMETINSMVSVFSSGSWFDGYYLSGKLKNGNENTDLKGNSLETVPEWICRSGLQFAFKKLSGILQYSYVSESYSDALNTRVPSLNGAKGLVPEYGIWDLNLSFKISSALGLKAGINNITNKQYFTKRPTGYPGQGVWSSDGRSFVCSVQMRI